MTAANALVASGQRAPNHDASLVADGGITSFRRGEKRSFDDPTLREIARQHGKSAA